MAAVSVPGRACQPGPASFRCGPLGVPICFRGVTMRRARLGASGPAHLPHRPRGVGLWRARVAARAGAAGRRGLDPDDRASTRSRHRLDRHRSRVRVRALRGSHRPRARRTPRRGARRHQVRADRRRERTAHEPLGADSVRREIEASLRRLRTDRIDLLQVHWPLPDGEIEEGWTEIARAVGDGIVRWAGRLELQRRAARARAGHPPGHLAPAALQHAATRRGGRPAAVLRGPRNRGHRLQPHGHRAARGRLHPRECRGPPRQRLAPAHPALPGARAFREPRGRRRPASRRTAPRLHHRRSSDRLGVRRQVAGAIVGAARPGDIEGTVGAIDLELDAEDLAEIGVLLAERERVLEGRDREPIGPDAAASRPPRRAPR